MSTILEIENNTKRSEIITKCTIASVGSVVNCVKACDEVIWIVYC